MSLPMVVAGVVIVCGIVVIGCLRRVCRGVVQWCLCATDSRSICFEDRFTPCG